MTDFTAHKNPILAVPCPDCQAKAGLMCVRPSDHQASDFHKARKTSADKVFIEQHGKDAWIDFENGQWVVHPTGHDQEVTRRKMINSQ
jgi:hypothetical protein